MTKTNSPPPPAGARSIPACWKSWSARVTKGPLRYDREQAS